MKKILLLSGILLSFFASEAQNQKTHTKKSKKNTISREARLQARLDSLQATRQLRIDSMVIGQLHTDSVRRLNDSLADVKFQQERMAWKESKDREIDSINKDHAKKLSEDHEQWLTVQKQRDEVNKSAKLNEYQGQQVNYINQSFFGKAQKIQQDSALAEDQKKQQLAKLNDERRSRLKSVLGKSKEKKLEKARKAHGNTNDKEVQWINDVEGYAKN